MFGDPGSDSDNAGDYLQSARGTRGMQDFAVKYVTILAGIIKEMKEEGKDVDPFRVTSGLRSYRGSANAIVSNWRSNGGPGQGTTYLVNLYYNKSMAKAVGLALEGAIVTTTASTSKYTGKTHTIRVDSIQMPGEEVATNYPETHTEVAPTIRTVSV
jgi:hypothetical protein